jgi:hypothetical protein
MGMVNACMEGKAMARAFDPHRGSARDNRMGVDTTSGDLRMDPATRNRTGMGSLGIMVAVGAALALGLIIWGMSDGMNTTASNTTPGVTTGSSTLSPSNSAAGSTGQGESNSTR